MANRTKVTQQKRARERAKQERMQAKTRKANEPHQPSGDEDPDIAGIIPGPQPSPWGDDDLLDEETTEK